MLTETKHHIGSLPADLYDLDIALSGEWVGVTGYGERQSVSFGGRVVSLPEPIMFPLVAAIDGDSALVVNSRHQGRDNAWVITSSGDVRAHFFAGDAIQDILASDTHLVITYFDESACTSPGVEGNGVAVFDLDGNYRFGYRELFGEGAVDIADCYCACWAEGDRVLFFPYTEFPLVSFDLENKSQEVWEAPGGLAGSNGLTSTGRTVYFHSPYEDEKGIYEWHIGEDAARRIGEHSGCLVGTHVRHLRGLRGGRFLAVEKSGYAVISTTET